MGTIGSQTIEGVKEALNNYIKGTYEADEGLLRSCFHEKAVMNGYMGDELMIATPDAFIQDVTSKPSMESTRAPYRAEVAEVSMTYKIATAVVRETGFFGAASFENHFQLVYDGSWKIVSKCFTTI